MVEGLEQDQDAKKSKFPKARQKNHRVSMWTGIQFGKLLEEGSHQALEEPKAPRRW
jgi:hypothetical protein